MAAAASEADAPPFGFGLLRRCERAALSVSNAFMFATMVIVVADVAMRYLFNSPFSWTYELIGLYLMAGIFFLTLSDAYAFHAHVSVDILQHRLSPTVRRLGEIVTCLAGIFVFVLIAWTGWSRTVESYQAGDVLTGQIPWPTWLSSLMAPVGSVLILIRFALTMLGHIATLATGRVFVGLPPLSGHDDPQGGGFE